MIKVKDFSLLEWEDLLKKLLFFLRTESAKLQLENYSPNFSFHKAKELYEETKFVGELLERGRAPSLPTLSSLKTLLSKGEKRGFFLPMEIAHIGLWLHTSQNLGNDLENTPFREIRRITEKLKLLFREISDICDLNTGNIRDRASYNLYFLRKQIYQIREKLLTKLEKIKDYYYKLGYLQDNFFLQREGRYVLPVRPEFKHKVRGLFQGYSNSGATVFIEPFGIISLRNELEEISWQEQREIKRILCSLSLKILTQRECLCRLEEYIARLDMALAKAQLGKLYRGIIPELKESGPLELREAYHPLLYLKALEQGENPPIPNNYYLKEGLVITGPNLGGKTVSLKTLGLIILMALNGFLIPATEAKIPYFKSVMVDLGDEQNLLKGESSFSAHLKNLKRILNSAEPTSLVLLDEPGRGTDPEEGAVLIFALIERLIKKGARVLITTHSHHLKALLTQRSGFDLATMGFDLHTHQPTYKLIYGYLGGSHAFELAKKIGFDEELLQRAKSFLSDNSYYDWQEKYLSELDRVEELRRDWERRLKELDSKREELEKLKIELKNRFDQALATVFEKWQVEFKEFLKSLPSKGAIKRAQEKFQKFLKEREIFTLEEDKSFHIGETLWITSLKREGKIIGVKDNLIEIQIGKLKLELPYYELKKIVSKSSPKNTQSSVFKENKVIAPTKERLNLIGEDVESGLLLLERKLNECFLKGVKTLLIIHGHGSGKLRSAIREYLRGHPLIENFEVAPPSEGGNGATIVYLC
ncbi:MAG: Smr/MutS family protein [Caldimicrobium sp.]|nr:Smr/MutS family protein [Caldimicrobium sp.]MCX7873229.1 Smr/MutS family protein [Caldimicrobium sp.]MDW8094119.1 Smr/MutS family protein [Caldimicrobium sp.]